MKKVLSVILSALTITSIMFLFVVSTQAASISGNKHVATGIKGGQTIYIFSNNGWNTEKFGNTYRTKLTITLPAKYRKGFERTTSHANCYFQIDVYKKVSGKWVKQTNLCKKNVLVQSDGVILKNLVLPGKGVNYKIKLNPIVYDWESFNMLGVQGTYRKVSDLNAITAQINYGWIQSVS